MQVFNLPPDLNYDDVDSCSASVLSESTRD